MPRPRKCKRVCCLPENDLFGPIADGESTIGKDTAAKMIYMTVDEYETIRLIDLEQLTQEQCAERMNVARTTVQKIYSEARQKLAISLVKGAQIRIEGGDYALCEEHEPQRRCKWCHKHNHRCAHDEENRRI